MELPLKPPRKLEPERLHTWLEAWVRTFVPRGHAGTVNYFVIVTADGRLESTWLDPLMAPVRTSVATKEGARRALLDMLRIMIQGTQAIAYGLVYEARQQRARVDQEATLAEQLAQVRDNPDATTEHAINLIVNVRGLTTGASYYYTPRPIKPTPANPTPRQRVGPLEKADLPDAPGLYYGDFVDLIKPAAH